MKTLLFVTLVCLSLGQSATAQDRYYDRSFNAFYGTVGPNQANCPPGSNPKYDCPPGGGWGVKGQYAGSRWGAWRFGGIPGYCGYGGHGGYGNGGWGGAYRGGGYPGHHPCERCW